MDKQAIKDYILYHCPDIPMLKKRITKAKLDSLDKHRMSEEEIRKAEADFLTKEKIVKKYMDRFPKYAAVGEPMMEQVLSLAPAYQNRDDLDAIRTDMRFCRFAYGFAMDEYVFFHLEGKGMEERRSYVSSEERIRAAYRMNDFSDMRILNDKWKTYSLLKPYYKRDAVLISRKDDFRKYAEFVKKHPVFVKKRLNLNCGQGVELIDTRGSSKSEKQQFDELIKERKLILEELIIQQPVMRKFNESSVNTVRCFTLSTRDGIVPYCGFIRTGRPGAFVDNAGSGGVFATIDPQSGRVIAAGCDETGCLYDCHPTSGIKFIGFQLPEWEKAREVCMNAAKELPRLKYIGWDLAYTEKGWIVVEANMAGQLVHQGSLQRGIKAELYAMMQNIDLIM